MKALVYLQTRQNKEWNELGRQGSACVQVCGAKRELRSIRTWEGREKRKVRT